MQVFGQVGIEPFLCRQTHRDGQRGANDQHVALVERHLAEHLNAGTGDHTEHQQYRTAEHRVGNTGNETAELWQQAGQHQESAANRHHIAANDARQCNHAYVLAETDLGERIENSGKHARDAIGHDAAGEFLLGGFTVQPASGGAHYIADGFGHGDQRQHHHGDDGGHMELDTNAQRGGERHPVGIAHLGEIDIAKSRGSNEANQQTGQWGNFTPDTSAELVKPHGDDENKRGQSDVMGGAEIRHAETTTGVGKTNGHQQNAQHHDKGSSHHWREQKPEPGKKQPH